MSKISKDELRGMMTFLIKFLDSFGDFLLSTGNLEKEHSEALDELNEIFTSPEALQSLVEGTEPDMLKGMVKVLFEFNNIAAKVQNVSELKADDKLKLGSMLKQLSSDIKTLAFESESR